MSKTFFDIILLLLNDSTTLNLLLLTNSITWLYFELMILSLDPFTFIDSMIWPYYN